MPRLQQPAAADFLGAGTRMSVEETGHAAETKRGYLATRALAELQLVTDPLREEAVKVDPVQASAAMRLEAASWPRLIYNPLKRSGHVTIDACTAAGTIQRYVCSKRQGKQVYTDARKARQGDAFPHEPANTPVVRERGIKKLIKVGDTPGRRGGKRPRDAELKELAALQDQEAAFGSGLLNVSGGESDDNRMFMPTVGEWDRP